MEIEAAAGVTVTPIAGGKSVTATVALPLLVGSWTLVAVMECVAALRGGVYSPPAEITPTLALPPGTPSTFHVTAGFWLLTTVAANDCVWIVEIEAAAGVTVTPIAGGGASAAIPPLSPPPQLTNVLIASKTRGRNSLVSGLREPVISGRHPAVFIAADFILEIVIMLDRIDRIAAVILDAGAHS